MCVCFRVPGDCAFALFLCVVCMRVRSLLLCLYLRLFLRECVRAWLCVCGVGRAPIGLLGWEQGRVGFSLDGLVDNAGLRTHGEAMKVCAHTHTQYAHTEFVHTHTHTPHSHTPCTQSPTLHTYTSHTTYTHRQYTTGSGVVCGGDVQRRVSRTVLCYSVSVCSDSDRSEGVAGGGCRGRTRTHTHTQVRRHNRI